MKFLDGIRSHFRTLRDMVSGKTPEQSATEREKDEKLAQQKRIDEAESRVRHAEEELSKAKAALAQEKDKQKELEGTLPESMPELKPVKREASYFLSRWRRPCLWYGTVMTLLVAVLWISVLLVNWNAWWQVLPEPFVICPVKILMRLLEYTLCYILVRLSFCWIFFRTVYDKDPSTREVYMELARASKWRFMTAFWNNAVLSTIKFYRNAWKEWSTVKEFARPAIRHVFRRLSENMTTLLGLGKGNKKNGKSDAKG